jgi:hypothetical protein
MDTKKAYLARCRDISMSTDVDLAFLFQLPKNTGVNPFEVTCDPGDYFEVKIQVPVTISNPNFSTVS